MYDSGINREEKEVVLRSITEVLRISGLQKFFPVSEIGDKNKIDLYLKEARKRGNQYNAGDILARLLREFKDGISVALVSRDLYEEGLNFVYGTTIPFIYHYGYASYINLPAGSIISLFRLRLWFRNSYEVLFVLASHEFGHILGIPNRDYNVEDTLGTHCIRGDCVMGQVNVVRSVLKEDGKIETRFISADELSRNALRRYKETGSFFCEDCKRDLDISRALILKLFGERPKIRIISERNIP